MISAALFFKVRILTLAYNRDIERESIGMTASKYIQKSNLEQAVMYHLRYLQLISENNRGVFLGLSVHGMLATLFPKLERLVMQGCRMMENMKLLLRH